MRKYVNLIRKWKLSNAVQNSLYQYHFLKDAFATPDFLEGKQE